MGSGPSIRLNSVVRSLQKENSVSGRAAVTTRLQPKSDMADSGALSNRGRGIRKSWYKVMSGQVDVTLGNRTRTRHSKTNSTQT